VKAFAGDTLKVIESHLSKIKSIDESSLHVRLREMKAQTCSRLAAAIQNGWRPIFATSGTGIELENKSNPNFDSGGFLSILTGR
jgi:hypothetical protein